MRKITDEQMAEAMGWTKDSYDYAPVLGYQWSPPGSKREMHYTLPKYTTSLDAIVAEIEARGLKFDMWWSDGEYTAYVFNRKDESKQGATVFSKTAPLALCAALLKYLEATK